MARPRKASDEQIFEAAWRVMQQRGPSEWTLADVAAAAGLTPGALVQRFGSKHQLQVTLMARFAEAVPGMYAGLRERYRSPLAALRAYAARTAQLAASAEGLAHHLDYLRMDLTDPEVHPYFRQQAQAGRSFIAAALRDACAAGELRRGTPVPRLARLVETVITGGLFTWATYREGTASAWMRRSLDDVLAPHLASSTRSRRMG